MRLVSASPRETHVMTWVLRVPKGNRDIVPGKPAFWRIPKGTFQRRAAAPPSGPLLGSWLTPTTDALPKATSRTAGGRLLRRSVEMLREPHGLSHWDPI